MAKTRLRYENQMPSSASMAGATLLESVQSKSKSAPEKPWLAAVQLNKCCLVCSSNLQFGHNAVSGLPILNWYERSSWQTPLLSWAKMRRVPRCKCLSFGLIGSEMTPVTLLMHARSADSLASSCIALRTARYCSCHHPLHPWVGMVQHPLEILRPVIYHRRGDSEDESPRRGKDDLGEDN